MYDFDGVYEVGEMDGNGRRYEFMRAWIWEWNGMRGIDTIVIQRTYH